jgi:hypothetical protein
MAASLTRIASGHIISLKRAPMIERMRLSVMRAISAPVA